MKSVLSGLMVLGMLGGMAGCSGTPPVRFHSLQEGGGTKGTGAVRVLTEILPVAVPGRMERAELVLTAADGGPDIHDFDRWAGPLPDEIRAVVTDVLWARLRAADVYRTPVAPDHGLPLYRLSLRVERFEARDGRGADVTGVWTLRRLTQGQAVTCRASVWAAAAGPGADAAARSLAAATTRLGEAIATSLEQAKADGTPVCPEG